MNAADMHRSARLRRAFALLQDGLERSTLDIILGARVCAVNSVVSELRANGCVIECRQTLDAHGERIWLYRMTGAPEPRPLDPSSGSSTGVAGARKGAGSGRLPIRPVSTRPVHRAAPAGLQARRASVRRPGRSRAS